MPLMRIARGESVGILLEPLSVISCTTLKACASLKDRTGSYHLRLTCHLLLSCLLYQFEFPTLFLAMREIIVNVCFLKNHTATLHLGNQASMDKHRFNDVSAILDCKDKKK